MLGIELTGSPSCRSFDEGRRSRPPRRAASVIPSVGPPSSYRRSSRRSAPAHQRAASPATAHRLVTGIARLRRDRCAVITGFRGLRWTRWRRLGRRRAGTERREATAAPPLNVEHRASSRSVAPVGPSSVGALGRRCSSSRRSAGRLAPRPPPRPSPGIARVDHRSLGRTRRTVHSPPRAAVVPAAMTIFLRIRQSFLDQKRSPARCPPRRTAAEGPVRALRRRLSGTAFTAPRAESPELALSPAPDGVPHASGPTRRVSPPARAVRRSAAHAVVSAGMTCSLPVTPTGFVDGLITPRRQRRDGDAPLRRQSLVGGACS